MSLRPPINNRTHSCIHNSLHGTHTQALTLEAILVGVHVFRCLDDKELLTTLEHLPAFLDAHPEVCISCLPACAVQTRTEG